MFGTLKKYKDKQFCEEHPVIHFDTLYEAEEFMKQKYDSSVDYNF